MNHERAHPFSRMDSILHATLLLLTRSTTYSCYAACFTTTYPIIIHHGYHGPTIRIPPPVLPVNSGHVRLYSHGSVHIEDTTTNIQQQQQEETLQEDIDTSRYTILPQETTTSDIVESSSSNSSSSSSEETHEWLRWMSSGHAAPRRSSILEQETEQYNNNNDGEISRPTDRYASKDWWHNTLNLHRSAILRSILFPVLSMTVWSLFITCMYRAFMAYGKHSWANKMCITSGPHSLTVSALGLLLVFRTNTAYQRFSEGRKIWEQILSNSRDLYRLCKLYEEDMGTVKLRRVQRLLAAFPYLLRFRIRPNSIMRRIDDPDYIRNPENSLILYQDHGKGN